MARNKKHKQKFTSKHGVAKKVSGRVVGGLDLPRASSAKAVHKGGNPSGTKERQKQVAVARRKVKNDAAAEEKRLGTVGYAPRILGMVPCNESANVPALYQHVQRYHGALPGEPGVPVTLLHEATKRQSTLVCETDGNEQDIADVAKVADVVLLVLDVSSAVQMAIQKAEQEQRFVDEETGSIATTWFTGLGLCITDMTRSIVSTLNAQGTPSVIVCLQGLDDSSNKMQQKIFKIHARYFESVLPKEHRVYSCDSDSEIENIMRMAHSMKLRRLQFREIRPYMIAEDAAYDAESQCMRITGWLRGNCLSANQLIHITNHGTYQVSRILDPLSGNELDQPDEDQQPLEGIQRSDTVEDEMLPTEEDVRFAAEETKRIRVPEGVSEYQAAWYENEPDLAADYEHDTIEVYGNNINNGDGATDAMTMRTTQTEVDFLKPADILRHDRLTHEERMAEIEALKEESGEEHHHPDHVDVPFDMPARQRFSKYRGMRSFHHGSWNTNENLPVQYGYIFKLQNYTLVRRTAIEEGGNVDVGSFVTIELDGVPPKMWDNASQVLLVSALLPHEQKYSVLHFNVERSAEYDEPIKSKTPMLAHVGFRKFYVCPLFSDSDVGDRAKFSRFFHEDEKFRVASFYGPISFHPCPVLLFKTNSLEEEREGAPLRLTCYGGALPPNPDKLLLKRAVLSGRVHVIHKKQIVVKYMFFNDEDVRYFQPVDLYTKFGRRGKITKAIGSHGLYKAQLNDMIMQHDVIMMDLYKRVYPKWNTVAFDVADFAGDDEDGMAADEEF